MPAENLIQPTFAKGQLAQELQGRVDTAAYKSALATALNVIIPTSGGVKNRPGLEFVDFAAFNSTPSRLRRFRYNATNSFMLEFSAFQLRFIQDDAFILDPSVQVVGVTSANPAVVHAPGHGFSAGARVVFDSSFTPGTVMLNSRTCTVGVAIDADHFTLEDPISGLALNGSAWPAYIQGGNVAGVYTLGTPYAAADLLLLKFVQDANLLNITHPTYPEGRLTWNGDATWTLTNPTYAPSIEPPTSLVVTPVGSTGSTTTSYVVTSTDAVTGDESLPSAVATITNANNSAVQNTITWTPPSPGNVSVYSVYKAVNGIFGFIGDTPTAEFGDFNFSPVLSTTPPTANDPFSGAGTYPGASMYWQQRLIRGGSNNLPSTVIASQTGNYDNMTSSTPSVDSDAITATLVSREVNNIQQFAPMADLIVLTAGSEWRITSNGASFSIENLDFLPQSSWGSCYLEPIVIGLTMLFVTENQVTVRSFKYQYLSNSYQGDEVTLLSSDLFGQYQMTAWSFGRMPDPLIISVRSDGLAVCATWQEEQQVNAWTLWSTQGSFQDVDIIRPVLDPAELDDVPYFVTVREIEGYQVRMIERLHSRRFYDVRDAFFVDCGLTYDVPIPINGITINTSDIVISAPNHNLGALSTVALSDIIWVPVVDANYNFTQPDQLNNSQFNVQVIDNNTFVLCTLGTFTPIPGSTLVSAYARGGNVRSCVTEVNGAYQLEGQVVNMLVDGNVVMGATVTNGTVLLGSPATRVHLGLGYNSDVQTLKLEAPSGTIQGNFRRIPYCTVRYLDTRGVLAGQFSTDLVEVKFREFEDYGEPTDMFTGDATVTMGTDEGDFMGQVFLRQPFPLPMQVLAIIPQTDVDDG